MPKNSYLQNGYVKCPHCGYVFKDYKLKRYSAGLLSGTGHMIGHVRSCMIGSSLGVTIGKVDIGGRLGGQAANYLLGNMNDMKFVLDIKCPKCGHKFK